MSTVLITGASGGIGYELVDGGDAKFVTTRCQRVLYKSRPSYYKPLPRERIPFPLDSESIRSSAGSLPQYPHEKVRKNRKRHDAAFDRR